MRAIHSAFVIRPRLWLCSPAMAPTYNKRRPKPPHVGTLGEHRGHRMTLWVYCLKPGCYHNARADLDTLCARYGDDTTVSDFVAMSRCTKCGARWPEIGITVTPQSPAVVSEQTRVLTEPSGEDPKG